MNTDYNDLIFAKLRSNFENPDIQACINVVNSIAGYESNNTTKNAIQYFYDYINSPEAIFITEWRSNPNTEKWYHKFVNGILGDVQNTITCVHYHYDNLIDIEKKVIESIERYNYREVLGNSCMSLGNTLKWDFEYQAYILAFRRCLDYLARSICSYFKNDFHSFRTLDNNLSKLKPSIIGLKINPIHSKYSKLFEFVLSEGDRKSTRDKITHYEYVGVGTINLSERGFILAGGGENLGFHIVNGSMNLTAVLSEKTLNLDNCISEILMAFVDAMKSV